MDCHLNWHVGGTVHPINNGLICLFSCMLQVMVSQPNSGIIRLTQALLRFNEHYCIPTGNQIFRQL